MLVSDKDRIEGVWNPVLDDDAERPLLHKSMVSLTRSQGRRQNRKYGV